MDMLLRNKIVPSIFFLLVSIYLAGCTSCSTEKTSRENPLFNSDTIRNFVYSKIGGQKYSHIWNSASDSIDNWRHNNLKGWAGDSTKGVGRLDSILCINSQADKVIMAILARELTSSGKLDAILYFYGVKIQEQWYFFSGPTMYIPRDNENLMIPTSFDKLHEIAMDNIFKGYLKKSEGNGKWEINDGFFASLTRNGGCADCKTQAQWDSVYLATVRENWKNRDTTNYQPLQ